MVELYTVFRMGCSEIRDFYFILLYYRKICVSFLCYSQPFYPHYSSSFECQCEELRASFNNQSFEIRLSLK